MGFWINSEMPFGRLTEISEQDLLDCVQEMERLDIVAWLIWNDHNGIYSDELSLKEFGSIMSKEEGMEILLRQVRGNRTLVF
jgi:hypothetical protein